MPRASAAFLVAAASLVGLPPLVGFTAQWTLLQGLFRALGLPWDVGRLLLPAVLGVVVLAAAAALGVAVRVIGPGFLGRPRSERAARARDLGGGARVALGGLMLALLAGGAAGGALGALATHAAGWPLFGPSGSAAARIAVLAVPGASVAPAVLAGVVIAGGLLAWLMTRGRPRRAPEWASGGVATPAAQMTATAYAQPLRHVFRKLLWPATALARPQATLLREVKRDAAPEQVGVFEARVFVPLRRLLLWVSALARRAQRETVHDCLVYVFITLAALLAAVMAWA